MHDYNFLNLSPFEFENLSRDVLQEKLGVFIESFTSGKDEGIDMRIAADEEHSIIIQAKRYDKYPTLKAALKKEVTKVYDLRPERYILTTSIGLTPANKAEIHALFFPYIQSTDDILGKDDLNNLLGQFPKIERKYYKLWLSSVAVLNKVIHSKVYNQSAFELDAIQETLQVYVQNDSFTEALAILKRHRYLIISGIPGIGKTTLARMLVYHLLAQGYEEFVYLSESINEGYTFFEEHKKQVLFFDDFLGKNFLETKLGMNEDHKLITFMKRVQQSKNTFLILTTREYILNQAKNTYEQLNTPTIDLAKCTLDLAQYTRFIRAEILYNHLFFAKIPIPHLSNLIAGKRYLDVISHPNYNPRIIETFVQNQFWNTCEAPTFTDSLLSFFHNPKSVWSHTFRHHLSKDAQLLLLILVTLGTPVRLEDVKTAVRAFIQQYASTYHLTLDSFTFHTILKELESTFISTLMDRHGQIAITFQNPSIHDFLAYYLRDKTELLSDVIQAFVFTNQFFHLFTLIDTPETPYKIKLTPELLALHAETLRARTASLTPSTVYALYVDGERQWHTYDAFSYSFLYQIAVLYHPIQHALVEDFVRPAFEQQLLPKVPNYLERDAYIKLLHYFKSQISIPIPTEKAILKTFIQQLTDIPSIVDVHAFASLFPKTYPKYIQSTFFTKQLRTVIAHELKTRTPGALRGMIHELKMLHTKFNLDLHQEFAYLSTAFPDLATEIDLTIADELEDHAFMEAQFVAQKEKEEQDITNLFESLLDVKPL